MRRIAGAALFTATAVGVLLGAAACSVPPPPEISPAYQPDVREQIGIVRDDLYRSFRSLVPCYFDPGGMLCMAHRSGWTPEHCGIAPATEPCRLYRRQIALMTALGARAPGDAHAIGQAVFALTRSGEFERASGLVDQCTAAAWWCTMLRGHVMAESGDIPGAEPVFDEMLHLMPDADLCTWTDLKDVVSGEARDALESEDCAAQRRRAETVWWLSDPAMMIPGNEARVAWFSRMAWAELHDDDLEETAGGSSVDDGRGHQKNHVADLLRWGPHETRASRAWREPVRPTLAVIPAARALVDPFRARPEDWTVEAKDDDFAIAVDWGAIESLDAQVSFFERGDSILAAAAVDIALSVVFRHGATLGAQLTLDQGPGATSVTGPTVVTSDEPGYRYQMTAMAPRGRHLVALEARTENGIGRTRFGHGLPQDTDADLRLSDILLYSPEGSEPADELDAVLPRMKGGTRWAQGETLGVYLEVYGPDEIEDYDVSVTLESLDDGGLLRRLAEAVGLADPENPLELSWFQPAGGGRFNASYTLALSDLEPGPYALEMSFSGGGVLPATVRRTIQVVPRDQVRR